MSEAPNRPWHVELATDAAAALRRLDSGQRRRIGRQLDALEEAGMPIGAQPHHSIHGAYTITAGSHELVVAVRPQTRHVLVTRIDALSNPSDLERPAAIRRRVPGRMYTMVADAGMDARFALRMFRRSPGLTAAVILTLALGIGGTSAIFSAFHTVYQSALPFEDGDRLVRLRNFSLGPTGEERAYNVPPRDVVTISELNRTFTGVVAMGGGSLALAGQGSPERISTVGVTDGWLALLGIEPLLGRAFSQDEQQAGRAAGVALIAHSLWQRRFGADSSVVGSTLAVEGGDLTVVGIMPPRFNYPYDAEIWTPFRLDPTDWRSHDLNVVARMNDDADLAAVRADMARVYGILREQDPGTAPDDGIHIATVRQDFIREDGRIVQALLVAVAFFLLLACVNVANLLTAHFVSRRREIGIRAALGAGGARQMRQSITETLLLFFAGGAVGLLLTAWLGNSLAVLLPNVLRDQLDLGHVGLNGMVAAFGLGLAVVAGLFSGLAAARRTWRTDLHRVLNEEGRGSSVRRSRFQSGLVVTELALSVVLLLGAGVMFDHFQRLVRQGLGFETDGLHTLQITLEGGRYAEGQSRLQLIRTLEEQLAAVPGVEAAGITSVNPLCCGDWGAVVAVEGRPLPPGESGLRIHHRYVTPSYFATMGIPLVQGEAFRQADRPGGPLEVVVDASLARRQWPGDNAVGKRMRLEREPDQWRTVVGVVGDIEAEGDYEQGWYLPIYQEPMGRSNEILHVMVRLRSQETVAAIRTIIRGIDPNLPVFGVTAMADLRRENIAQDRIGAILSVAFAGFGLLLATVGLYSLMAYLVSLRTREIATRIALGASRRTVLQMVMSQAGGLVAAGAVVGLGFGYALNRILQTLATGVAVADVRMLLPLIGTLIVVAGTAVFVPAVRAARVDPVRAFRGE